MKLNIYKLSQDEIFGPDTYDSCIVVAESEDEAKRFIPYENYNHSVEKDGRIWHEPYCANWATHINKVKCELLGSAIDGLEKGVIISSYNAS